MHVVISLLALSLSTVLSTSPRTCAAEDAQCDKTVEPGSKATGKDTLEATVKAQGDSGNEPGKREASTQVEEELGSRGEKRRQQLAAINEEILEANKLLKLHEAKLRLLERKRRLLFPGESLPEPPPHDDFVPDSREPLIKHVPISNPPNSTVTTIKLLPSPLLVPRKAGRNTMQVKMAGAILLAAAQGGSLNFYNAVGDLVKAVDTGFGDTPITAIGASSVGHKALIALGGADGTVAMYDAHQLSSDINNFTVTRVSVNLTQAADAELKVANSSQAPVSAAAVTALHIMPSSRNVIVYIGDAAGWVRAYSKEGIIMAQTKAEVDPEAEQPAVSSIACCAGVHLVVGLGQSVALIATTTFKPFPCHQDTHRITSIAIDSKTQLTAFLGTHSGEFHTMRVARHVGKKAKGGNSSHCHIVNTRKANTTGLVQLQALNGYLLVQDPLRVAVYNATRALHFAPWHVLDVPSNASDHSKALLATDGASSWAIVDGTTGGITMYHSGLPQLSAPAGLEIPGRPYIIAAAVLIAFGYQFYNRKGGAARGKGGSDDLGGDMDEFAHFGASKKSGYGKYGPPSGKSSGKFGSGGFDRGGGGGGGGGMAGQLDNFGNQMHDVGKRTQAIEERMQQLGSMTSDLSSALGNYK